MPAVPLRDRHFFTLYTLGLIVANDADMHAAFHRYADANFTPDDGDPFADLERALTFFRDEAQDIRLVADGRADA